MENQKSQLALNVLIKISVAVLLVVAASTRQQYSFYSFLRWAVMIPSAYFAYRYYSQKQIGLLVVFVAIALLFNPFHKFWFQKETWHLVDYLVAAIIAISISFDWVLHNKNKPN